MIKRNNKVSLSISVIPPDFSLPSASTYLIFVDAIYNYGLECCQLIKGEKSSKRTPDVDRPRLSNFSSSLLRYRETDVVRAR